MEKKILNKFEITQTIGKGSMGNVYLAFDSENNREVAVKELLIKSKETEEESILRFQREADIISNLSHPYIIKIYSVIKEQGNYYIIMEYFNSSDLSQTIDNYSINDKIHIIKNCADALEYIHKKNIIHRDIKPRNILVRKNGNIDIRIIDFGLAYLTNFSDVFTSGTIVGSFVYISPEQTGLLRRNVDNRSDLYSLGVTFYELLTGIPPFQSNDFGKLIHRHLAEKPIPPSFKNKNIPCIIDKIVLKLLQKDPDQRYQSAKGLSEDLQRFLSDEKKEFSIGSSDDQRIVNFQIKLVGREKEIKIIRDNYLESLNNDAKFVMISGKSGYGKSKLVETFLEEHLKAETVFLSTKCTNSSKNIPYYPFNEIIKMYFKRNYSAEKKTEIIKTLKKDAEILTSIFPFLRNLLKVTKKKKIDSKSILKTDIHLIIKNFFATLCEISESVIFFIDDFQCADVDSIELFSYLTNEINKNKFLLILTFREDFKENIIIQKIITNNNVEVIQLEEIKKDKIKDFVNNILLGDLNFDNDFYSYVFKNSLGIPFYILELIKNYYQNKIISNKNNKWQLDNKKLKNLSFKKEISNIISERLNILDKRAIEVLSFAAVIGKEFNLDLLAELLYTKENNKNLNELVFIIDKSINEYIIEENLSKGKGVYSFVHDKITETLYDNLEDNKRKEIHLLCAKTYEALYKNNIDEVIYHIAYHYNKTLEFQKKLVYNLEAFEKAISYYSLNEAIYYLSSYIDIKIENKDIDLDCLSRIVFLANLMQTAGKIKESFKYLEVGGKIAKEQNFLDIEIKINLAKGTGYYFSNDIMTALIYFNSAVSLANNAGKEIKIARPYYLIGWGHYFNFNLDEAEYYINKAVEYSDEEDDFSIYLQSHALKAYFYMTIAEFDISRHHIDLIENKVSDLDNTLVLSQLYHIISTYYSIVGGKPEKGLNYSLKSYELAEKSNNALFQFSSMFSRQLAYNSLGDYDKVIEIGECAIEFAEKHNVFIGIHLIHACIAEAYILKNDFEKANSVSMKFLEQKNSIHHKEALLTFYKAHIVYLFFTEEYEDALVVLKQAYEVYLSIERMYPRAVFIYSFMIMVLEKLGNKNEIKLWEDKYLKLISEKKLDTWIKNVEIIKKGLDEKAVQKKFDSSNVSSSMTGSFFKERIQLKNIISTSQLISNILDIDELLVQVLEKTLEVTGAERGVLLLYNHQGKLEHKAVQNIEIENNDFKISRSIINKVEKNKKGLVVSSVDNEDLSDSRISIASQNILSIICTPLILRTRMIGILYLDSKLLDNLFTEEDLKLLDVFTAQVAIAIENARAYEELEKERDHLEMRVEERTKKLLEAKDEIEKISEIAQHMSISLDYDAAFNTIFKHLSLVYGFEGCSLSLIEEDSETYKIEKVILPDYLMKYEKISKEQSFPLNKNGGRIARCIIDNKIYFISDAMKDVISNDIDNQVIDLLQIKSVMNIPIEIGGNIIGAFSLSSHSRNLDISSEDIQAIKRFVKQISVVLRNAKLYEEISQKKEELEMKDKLIREDLFLAKKIQNNVMSKDYMKIDNLKINIHFQPMIEVGGDIYDIFELKKNYFRIFIADATGHGVQAALTTMIIKGEYDKIKTFDIPTNQLLMIFNNSFYQSYENLNVFFTCVVFDIDFENNKIYYSSAGHPKQYLVSNKKLIKLETGGTLFGVIDNIVYRNHVISFKKGDVLYLLSDGLFEEFNEIGLELGENRLEEYMEKNINLSMTKFMGNVLQFAKSWVGDSGFTDDITFMGIEYL